MKKRLAAIVCAAALGVTALTGCASGKQETTAGTETAAAAATEKAADEESKAEAGGGTAATQAAAEITTDSQGLASLSDSSYLASDLCRPRRQEIFACFDRCRELQFN